MRSAFAESTPLHAFPAFSAFEGAMRETRRAACRRAVVIPCQAVREHDFKLIADRTLDMSADGVLVPLRAPVLTGESLIVSFSIPGMWIDVEATVARIVHGRRHGDDGLAAGVVFDRISPSARAALVGFLHARRSPLPRRGPLARLRRGQAVPQLADADMMRREGLHHLGSMAGAELADVDDVTEIAEVIDVAHGDAGVDGLGMFRAVVGAWQRLLDPPMDELEHDIDPGRS